MANFKDSEFGKKLKRVCSNRAVIATIATLLTATLIIVAMTVSANRTKLDGTDTSTETESVTTDSKDVFNGEDTLPTYNSGDTDVSDKLTLKLPVRAGVIAKDHDPTIQVYSATMGDYRVHIGLDIATDDAAPVMAVASGKVTKIWNDALMGTCVAIDHGDADKTVSVYKNLAKDLASGISENASVSAGQQLGVVGDTAIIELADEPHLHFEMTVGGISVDPKDYFEAKDIQTLTSDSSYESGK